VPNENGRRIPKDIITRQNTDQLHQTEPLSPRTWQEILLRMAEISRTSETHDLDLKSFSQYSGIKHKTDKEDVVIGRTTFVPEVPTENEDITIRLLVDSVGETPTGNDDAGKYIIGLVTMLFTRREVVEDISVEHDEVEAQLRIAIDGTIDSQLKIYDSPFPDTPEAIHPDTYESMENHGIPVAALVQSLALGENTLKSGHRELNAVNGVRVLKTLDRAVSHIKANGIVEEEEPALGTNTHKTIFDKEINIQKKNSTKKVKKNRTK
jgi:hypothetical protein